MNKEELIKEYDEKAKALRDEFISKLEDDKKEFELTYPEDGQTVYRINGVFLKIWDFNYSRLDYDAKNMFEHGYVYYTKEEAEQYLKERKLLFKLQQWAKLKNDGWKPDWEDVEERKYYIEYSGGKLNADWYFTLNKIIKLPYFKSEKIAQECIDLFGDEIKEVLC